jgi:hypothetical protein
MVRKQEAVTFGRRFLERRDFIPLSIQFEMSFPVPSAENSSFGPSRSAFPIA